MPTVEISNLVEGTYGPVRVAGAPVAGTDEVQTVTFGGTPTGGTFRLTFDGHTTAAITWVGVNATLVANIDAALEALANVGVGGVVVAVGTLVAGIGGATVTFSGGNLAKRAVSTMSVANNSLTGTTPTVAVTETTPGVNVSGRGAEKGAILIDTTNGTLYQNTGTPAAPVWGTRT